LFEQRSFLSQPPQTIRAHAMGGLNPEILRKILLQLQPFAFVSYFATSRAEPQEFSQMMQPVGHPFGEAPDDGPDVKDYQRLQSAVPPIPRMRPSAKKGLRQSLPFISPGKDN
jgi:hypothetical protein